MKNSIYCRFKKDYSDKLAKLFEKINQLEREIKSIDIDISFDDLSKENLAILEFKREIILYFKYDNGSMGADKFLISNILHELLVYIFILKEKKLSEAEKNTCTLEIENRFYFFLNLIYNYTEKIKEFCNISEGNNKVKIIKKETIFNTNAIKDVEELFENYFNKMKDYIVARGIITHHLYRLEYHVNNNEIKISESKFKLTNKNLHSKKIVKNIFPLNFGKLINVVEDLYKFHKKILEYILEKDSINLKKLVYKFYSGKGTYEF